MDVEIPKKFISKKLSLFDLTATTMKSSIFKDYLYSTSLRALFVLRALPVGYLFKIVAIV